MKSFDCGDDEINTYLKMMARADGHLLRTTTHVLTYAGDPRVLAYVAVTMGHIRASLDGRPEKPVGVLHVTYVGRDKIVSKNGWGKYMLAWVYRQALKNSRELGCRGVALNCYEDRVSFYENLGFSKYGPAKKDPDNGKMRYPMFLDLLNPAQPSQ